MTPSRHIFLFGCIAAIHLLGAGSVANATVVDFNGIPDGTLVSTGNPYAGVLNLQATVHWSTIEQTFSAEGTISTSAPFLPAGDGVVRALPPIGFPDAGDLSSDVTGTFLQPVTNVSFEVFVFRNASYSYTGTDGLGGVFNGGAIITGYQESGLTLTWQQIGLSLPVGYTLTTFSVHNADPASTSDAAVWLDNVAFAVVPEPSTTLMLGVGAVLLSVLVGARGAVKTLRTRRR